MCLGGKYVHVYTGIGRSGERWSGISMLAARHDDNDIYIYIYIYIYTLILITIE